MPAHQLDFNDKPTLLRIIATLIEESEAKEIRFSAAAYDSFDRQRLCIVDFDKKKGEIVLRLTSADGRIAVVTPEAQQWTLPLSASPLERTRLRAERDAELRTVPSDEILADMEERLAQQQTLASDVEAGKSPTRIKIRP